MMNASNCLNLVGDGDELDVLSGVQKAFGVEISNAEARRCETVGMLFDVICSKLKMSDARHLGCPTSLAFFRLRAALRRRGYTQRITPDLDLRAGFHARGVRRMHASLAREVGLDLPGLQLHSASAAVLVLVWACGFPLAVWTASWVPLLACTILTIMLGLVLPRTLPDGIAKLGDFAVSCAAWNYGRLAEQCGGARPCGAWKAFTIVVRESSGTGFEGEMNYDTRLFLERKSRAR
jgi:hypothetical protein